MIRRALTSVLRFALPLALAPSVALAQRAVELPVPDALVQAEIRAVVHAAGPDDHAAALDALSVRRRADAPGLAAQLFLYSAAATSTRDGMALALLARQLHLERGDLARAVVPYFESELGELRAAAAGVMAEYEGAEPDRPPSFAVYVPFLQEALHAEREPPPGLMAHLYATHPGTALRTWMRLVEQDRDALRALLWAEHVLADAVWKHTYGFAQEPGPEALRELERVTRDPRWWVRAYAAALQARHAFLSQPDGLARLRGDAHPLVRRLAR